LLKMCAPMLEMWLAPTPRLGEWHCEGNEQMWG
jgi:hypothetical protein